MTMHTLIRAIYIILAAAIMLVLPQGCLDDPFNKYETIPDGYGMATLNLTFTPNTDVTLATRGTAGDAIKDIENIFIAVYTIEGENNGTLVHSGYYMYEKDFTTTSADRNMDYSTTENSTQQATISNIIMPYGRYHIYAVANMGDLSKSHEQEIQTEEEFRAIRFNWNENNVASNNQMSGYFTNSTNYPTYNDSEANESYYLNSPQEVVFSPGNNTLHAWLRRAVSKVTIDYDASNLNENIYIYLKSATIRDIPASCSLVNYNTPSKDEDIIRYEDITDADVKGSMTIQYSSNSEEDPEGDFTYVLSRGHSSLDVCENAHSNDAEALFFYENMQGTGKDKRQDANEDGFLDDAGNKMPGDSGWKDSKPYGTYIEVEAYYVSSAPNNHGRGIIKYRFMLGKNVTTDYNAERNHHYKLTLKFNGNANDIDWHIDYEEEDRPGIYTPVYYVSYRYNEPDSELIADDDTKYWAKCYPIRLAGDKIGETVTVRIVENNWGSGKKAFAGDGEYEAYGAESGYNEDYPDTSVTTFSTLNTKDTAKPKLNDNVDHTGVWHGFLSLYDQGSTKSLGTTANEVWGRFSAGEYIYWYSRGKKPYYSGIDYDGYAKPLTYDENSPNDTTKNQEFNYGEGYRIYSTKPGIHDDGDYGKYKVEVSYRSGIKETTLYIPLYTRPLIINQKKGFTGMNPYFSYQRYAKLRINAEIDGKNKTHYADVYQVRRIINPKGVFRSYNNNDSFRIDLAHRTAESDEVNFTTFASIGPWRASIVVGSDKWEIVGATGEFKKGSSGSTVSMTVRPKKRLENNWETANALLLIEYHDYKCVHYVHLRQGYAPIKILANGPYWHTFNVSYVNNASSSSTAEAVMSHGPLDPGAMYRYGNLSDAIDLINNTKNFRDKRGSEIYAYPDDGFVMGPVGKDKRDSGQFKKWANISASTNWSYTSMHAYDNVSVRLPNYKDFNDMRLDQNAKLVDYAYGVCYGDGATEIDTDASTAFFYSRYNHHGLPDWIKDKYPKFKDHAVPDSLGQHGMRGCFVYNKENANVVFFPMGASSYGRRKSVGHNFSSIQYGDGALHYGDFDVQWDKTSLADQAQFVPVLRNLNSNYGACYWLGDQEPCDDGDAVAWDFNYSTIDFAPIYVDNLHTKNNNGDACFLRLVQDIDPTKDQCNKMTDQVDKFRASGDNFWNQSTDTDSSE